MKKEYSLSGKIGKKALSANITLSPFTEKAKDEVKTSKILEHLVSGDSAKLAIKYPELYVHALQISAAMDEKTRTKHKELGKLEKSFSKNKMRTKKELVDLFRSAIKAGAKESKEKTTIYVNDEKLGTFNDLIFKGSKGTFDSDNLKMTTDDLNISMSGKPTVTKKDGKTILTITKKGTAPKKSTDKKPKKKTDETLVAVVDEFHKGLMSSLVNPKTSSKEMMKIKKEVDSHKKLFSLLKKAKEGKAYDVEEFKKEAKKAKINGYSIYSDDLDEIFTPRKVRLNNPPTNFVATGFIGLSSAGITGYAKHALEKRYSRFVSYPALIASLAASGYFMPKNRQAIIVGGLFGILAQEFLAWRMRSLKLSVGAGSISGMGKGSGSGGVVNLTNPMPPQNVEPKNTIHVIVVKDNKIYKDGQEITLEQWTNFLDTNKKSLDRKLDLTFDTATVTSNFSLKVEEPLNKNGIIYHDRTKYTNLKGM